ncbi:hypothetical protein [Paenibacillus larvae]|nr:hypothetical protein [Paenibacillus larvae]ETK27398.1 hypothetical protein ERIC1_1c08430 [Paenibacillus larvae subsp. larvae DSM 25719]MDT2268154.1 hypothetical protein [Paenibacillus larvae]MDT2277878.1 hypothetical protein [Paenibacillus larvae]MDT2306308.1 hypothetical protein [Paenibacillus larvae]
MKKQSLDELCEECWEEIEGEDHNDDPGFLNPFLRELISKMNNSNKS